MNILKGIPNNEITVFAILLMGYLVKVIFLEEKMFTLEEGYLVSIKKCNEEMNRNGFLNYYGCNKIVCIGFKIP